ncbi:hypothetical protein EDC18_101425 [Natranaerovirga pectinivora]|uniref:Uncharacterized protein n=1 Tax=Natranaerovirga pectinivora TaxID=682400 RepID=A0A4R3MPA3_9FIRM|nr:hypothetical protein [Natranaerovirga pectinivora]TCT17127.1 hypothetical protein EDC18_101425 [Natranaerovirga pectinivora]
MAKAIVHEKLMSSKEFLDSCIVEKPIAAKKTGNLGAHEGEEANVTDINIQLSLEAVSNFSIEMFVSYFKMNGFHNSGVSAWIPTVFSTLPPKYRIQILEKYFDYDNSILIIDKLAMAYLKDGLEEECFKFIDRCYKESLITEYPLEIMYLNIKVSILQ